MPQLRSRSALLPYTTLFRSIAAFRINREKQAAQTALGEAKEQKRLAAEQELLARRRFYAAQINLAGQAAETGDLARCVELLRSEEHTSELQSLRHLVCRLLL